MDKIIYFNNDNQKKDYCNGTVYYSFIDYAFSRTTSFMLVYVNYNQKGYTKITKKIKNALEPYKIKSRSNPVWPGTSTQSKNTTYKIVFYQNTPEAKEVLKSSADCMSSWKGPTHPQDLAFFIENQCWFYSVGHEKIGAVIHANEEDLEFLESIGLASKNHSFIATNDFYSQYDER